ncbi:F-box domain containing protein [Tanacetum coccineum]|uniref:F-box domain containing protein n=1 Tax=Tanacetum coccineum TaxID=301880 RepID=A0ABQ4YTT0_9ASTR
MFLLRMMILSRNISFPSPSLGFKKRERAVIWNPCVRKCVDVIVPNVLYSPYGYTVVGFGIYRWEVEVFSLSSRVWKRVSIDPPLKPCDLSFGQVCIRGFIYWHAFDNIIEGHGVRANMIISYDLTSGVFGEVSLPDCLVYAHTLSLCKRDQCLALLEYYKEDEIAVCVPGKTDRASEFRKNGEAIRETEDDTSVSNRLEVYEPCSQHISDIGISGNCSLFAVTSYVETLLLLDRSDSVIRVAR